MRRAKPGIEAAWIQQNAYVTSQVGRVIFHKFSICHFSLSIFITVPFLKVQVSGLERSNVPNS